MSHRCRIKSLLSALLPLLLIGAGGEASTDGVPDSRREAAPLLAGPLLIVENGGQTDRRAPFYARGTDMDVFFTTKGLTFAIGRSAERFAVRADFLTRIPSRRAAGPLLPPSSASSPVRSPNGGRGFAPSGTSPGGNSGRGSTSSSAPKETP
jgi:hypothetical protein